MIDKQDGLIFPKNLSREVLFMLAVAGLGFMVDVYDMALFGVVRVQSLNNLGVTGAQALSAGVLLLNWQMAGMVLGGLLWGVFGDKRGRRSILLGSIVLYSIANIANAFVNSVDTYAAARFFVGLGLAGEVGAAMTIAAEVTPKSVRAYGTAGVAAFSTLGAILASLLGNLLPWRMAYITAGAAGFGLLLARFSLKETAIFQSMQNESIERGIFVYCFPVATECYDCSVAYLLPLLSGSLLQCSFLSRRRYQLTLRSPSLPAFLLAQSVNR